MKSDISVAKLETADVKLAVAGTTIDNICVTGTGYGKTVKSGPGC